jgi:hypothetical protein
VVNHYIFCWGGGGGHNKSKIGLTRWHGDGSVLDLDDNDDNDSALGEK